MSAVSKFHRMNASIIDWLDSYGVQHTSLVSYSTLVCDIIWGDERVDIVLFQHYRHSSSTARQVTRFISEQTCVKWTMKKLDECFNGMDYFEFNVYDDYTFERTTYWFEKVDSPYGKLNRYQSMFEDIHYI